MSVTAPDGSVWPAGSLRAIEHQSIRDFVQRAADDGYLSGRVLDYGCGRQPYRGIVEAVGDYYAIDDPSWPASMVEEPVMIWPTAGAVDPWDAVLCTQVIQYMPEPWRWFYSIREEELLAEGGYLVLTYPTNWPEVQDADLHRFTKAGMERLLTEAGFEIIRHESRASITCLGEKFSLGGGVIARA